MPVCSITGLSSLLRFAVLVHPQRNARGLTKLKVLLDVPHPSRESPGSVGLGAPANESLSVLLLIYRAAPHPHQSVL